MNQSLVGNWYQHCQEVCRMRSRSGTCHGGQAHIHSTSQVLYKVPDVTARPVGMPPVRRTTWSFNEQSVWKAKFHGHPLACFFRINCFHLFLFRYLYSCRAFFLHFFLSLVFSLFFSLFILILSSFTFLAYFLHDLRPSFFPFFLPFSTPAPPYDCCGSCQYWSILDFSKDHSCFPVRWINRIYVVIGLHQVWSSRNHVFKMTGSDQCFQKLNLIENGSNYCTQLRVSAVMTTLLYKKHLKSLQHVSILRSSSGSYTVPC